MIVKAKSYFFNKSAQFAILIFLSVALSACTINTSITTLASESSAKDDESKLPVVGFNPSIMIVAESIGSVSVPVTLSKASAKTVSVTYSISGNSTATGNGVDYNLVASTLTFAPGETTKAISIDIIDDSLNEEDETIVLSLSGSDGAKLSDGSTITIQITDNDLPPKVDFSVAAQTVSEVTGTATVTVNLSAASSKIITVPFSVDVDSTASPDGVDYTLSSSSLTFNPGQTSKQISVALVNDGFVEADKYIILDLGAVVNATPGAITLHMITLTSDDVSPTVPTGLILGSIPKTLDQSPTLSWSPVAGASYYQVQIFDSLGTTPVSSAQTMSSGSAITSLSLTASTLYTIKVRAVDSFGNLGAWGATTWTSYCDATWSNTVLAMELDGAMGSTSFLDVSSANKTPLTAVGNAKLSTVQKFNGSASAYFDGSGDYITTPSSADWNITGDYTIEARIYVSVAQLNPIATALIFASNDGWGFYVAANGSIYFSVKNGATTVQASSAAGAVSAAAWHHVAAVRSGTDLIVYVDGAQVALSSGSPTTIGTYTAWLGGSISNSFNGYIDDFKVTKGTARYTGSMYSVPNKTLLCQ